MNLWNTTTGYGATASKVGYLDDEQNCRLERIRVARLLWKGKHRQAYLEEGRTQFDYPEMRVGDKIIRPYLTVNVLRMISTTLTDLLLGEEPLLKVEDEFAQTTLDELIARSHLHRVFYESARESSWAAEGTVEIARWNGLVYIVNVRPCELFPIGSRNPDGQYNQYRRFATQKVGDRRLLLETTYEPGAIRRACFWLTDAGGKGGAATMKDWPVKTADGQSLPEAEGTGLDVPSIVWMPNEPDEGCPTCDFDGLIELQDSLNHKETQIARVLAKHADPKLGMPEGMVDGEGNVRANKEVFFFRSKDEIPTYLVWNAELTAAMEDRDAALNHLSMTAELSQVLLGIKQGATPDAARTLRLEATKSLSRTKRKALFVRPFIRTAIDTAMRMINAGYIVQVAMGGTSVEMRDSLPVDELDEAQALSLMTGGQPVMAQLSAIERRVGDAKTAVVEQQQIQKESESRMPAMTFGGPTPTGAEPGEVLDDETEVTE